MTPYPLHRSERSTKIMITLFLCFMVGSFTIALLNVYDKVGRVKNGIEARYGPDTVETGAAAETAPTAAPDGIYGSATGATEESDRSIFIAKMNTFSALLDLTHPHIFEMPIIILVLCHFLMRTRLVNWAKVITYFLSFGGVAGMLATPWLVRYLSIKFAPLMLISAVSLAIAALVLIFVPLWDMWAPNKRRNANEKFTENSTSRFAAD
jgi:hypothetical protein